MRDTQVLIFYMFHHNLMILFGFRECLFREC